MCIRDRPQDVLPTYDANGQTRRHWVTNVATATGTNQSDVPTVVDDTDTHVKVEAAHTVRVTFIDGLYGTQLQTELVPYGGSTQPPKFPGHEGYDSVGWSGGCLLYTSRCV